ncbi:MAG: aminomethyl-transferring glycine dehydrogenase subunit GcvPA [Candidatus Fermentibacteraceae bacterium]|nr:aminomethyl-transferring glycine dehydrogenase subunit GcvPA [Candidatus Fermentibacteraceae bacterium]
MSTYIPNGKAQRKQMLDVIGVERFEDLLSPIPESVRFKGELDLPAPVSELELVKEFKEFAAVNSSADLICFRGAGAYDHFIPSAIDNILTRSEFFTAYTPYQAEVSQGTLQAIFEYQTMIARLTGCDAANACMYDGASATAEAALMAIRATKKKRVLVSGSLNPRTIDVMHTYIDNGDFEINEVPFGADGLIDLEAARQLAEGGVAALVLQYPNFFGSIEDIQAAANFVHEFKGLLVVTADPIALGVIEAPGKLGADIVVGEGQPMGIAMSYGGPYVGFMATSTKLLRKMPGRIVGRTEDRAGNTGYVLTLQTREQHIRRAKATSNICSNQALMALANVIYLTLAGEDGFVGVAAQCWHKSHYLFDKLLGIDGVTRVFNAPFCREFVVDLPVSAESAALAMEEKGYLAGLPIHGLGEGAMMLTVTEKRTREEIDGFADALSEFIKGVR